MWANHFEPLGQPTVETSFDEPFRLKVESAVQEICIDCLNTLSCTNSIFIFDVVKEVCQGLKCGVAGGPDMTSYEHLKYGDPSFGIYFPNYILNYFVLMIFPRNLEDSWFSPCLREKVPRPF